MNKTVAVIIINWNALSWTDQCIQNLKEQYYQNFSTFIVDNASQNKEADVIEKKWGNFVTVIRADSNLGFASGNNLALCHEELQKFDYYLLLNNDTKIPQNLISDLVNLAESENDIGIVGPLIKNWEGESIQTAGARRINLWTGSASMQTKASSIGAFNEVEMLSGCCLLVKKEVVNQIGVLDPDYFAYYEETDYCLRALRKGFKILLSKSVEIRHFDGGSAKEGSNFHERQLLRNRFLFVKKNGNYLQRLTTFLYVVFFYMWVRCVILIISRQSQYIRGVFEGVWSSHFTLR